WCCVPICSSGSYGLTSQLHQDLDSFVRVIGRQVHRQFSSPSPPGFGRKDVVEHLLQTGANVHARDDGGLIPLHNACSFGHAEVVSLLLCHGADPNARDNWNYTPLHEAAIKGKIDVCIGEEKRRVCDYAERTGKRASRCLTEPCPS
uniref:Uncharacterized protein n=1 Tax=Cynoglossus semilaevis TaxID=244447 RepID=A0A3P8VFZ6_CYNSE